MSQTFNTTFSLQTTASLLDGDRLFFKFVLSGSSQSNFTASLTQGSLAVSSQAVSTGYTVVDCPYLSSTYINTGSNSNEIVFTQAISSLYGDEYIFAPSPTSGSAVSSLYTAYGDVAYAFKPEKYDIAIIQLSDNTYIVAVIIDVYIDTNSLLRLTLNIQLSQFIKDDITNDTYKRFLVAKRVQDEQNVIVRFSKKAGQTSYGFIIPDNIDPEVMANINTLQAAVKSQLLSDQ